MKLRDLEYLVALAEIGHFGKAAEACNVSQPALSGQVRKLEEYLGVTLFERNNRQVRTTEIGLDIVRHARTILAEVAMINETARNAKDPMSGKFRLGAIMTIGPDLTPLLLPSLRHALPRLDLSLTEAMTARLEEMLLDGQIDAAITATEPDHPGLASISLYREPLWVAVPNGHALAARDEIDIEDIKPADLLLLSDGHCFREQALSFCSLETQKSANLTTQDTSLTTILSLVAAGMGVTLIPALAISGPWATDSGISFRKDISRKAHRTVRLIYRSTFPRKVLLEKIADVIAAIVPDTVEPARR